MDYSWNTLADRCQLFVDAERPLLVELLKEAQSEMSNACMMYDSVFTYQGSQLGVYENRNTNYGVLPSDYLQDIGVWCNGVKLKKLDEGNLFFEDNGATDYKRNQPDSGEPYAYCISGGHIQFNSMPESGDQIMLYYKARITSPNVAKLTYFKAHSPRYIDLPFNYGVELNGLTLKGGSFSATNLVYSGPVQQMFPKVLDPYYYNTNREIDADNTSTMGTTSSRYVATYALVANQNISMGFIEGFGSRCRVIPAEYHTALCDYAIALSVAKKAPEIHDKHIQLFYQKMEGIVSSDAEKDLIFNMREVI